MHDGQFPRRGDLLSQAVVDLWVCDVGHQTVTWEAPCGSAEAVPQNVPTGALTSGYIHYPTYFVGGEVFRAALDAVSPGREALDTYRQYAAVMLSLAGLVSLLLARRIGLRGGALVAATLAPIATSSILVYGTMENPMSAAPLCGALVAGAGLSWVLSGRGFWWLAAASAVSAGLAVTSSLPTGVFILACLGAMVQRRRGKVPATGWLPRWWHVAVLATILLIPIIAFGAWTSSRATASNEQLYSGNGFDSWTDIAVGMVFELSTPHVPWANDGSVATADPSLVQRLLLALLDGTPFLLVVLVGGALALGAMRVVARAPDDQWSPLPLLAGACMLGLVLYPPLLRLANAVNVGIDFPIVSRYSISLLPLLVWVALLGLREHAVYGRVLGLVAAGTVLAVCASSW